MNSIRKRTRNDEDEDYNGDGGFRRGGRPMGGKYGPPQPARDPRDVRERKVDIEKEEKELFVGNVVGPTTEKGLQNFLNDSMREGKMVTHHDPDPIIHVRLTGQYGFVEFRDAELCTLGLNMNGIPYMNNPLKLGRPTRLSGGGVVANNLSWQQWMQEASSKPGRSIHPVLGDLNTKLYREIFVGNCTPEMPEKDMQDFLGGILYKLGLSSSGQENPVMGVKSSGKFAFVVLRTVEEAANLLNFNRIPYMGSGLKFERPAKFDGGIAGVSYYNWDDLQRMWMSGELKLMTAGNPSKIVRVVGQASLQDLQNSSAYVDLMEETRAEAAQFGTVRSVIIPRTSAHDALYAPGDEHSRVFVEMGSVEEAKQLVLQLKGRSYNGRWVDVKFYPEDKFRMQNYFFDTPGIVLTASYGPVFKEQVLNPASLKKIWGSD